MIILFRQIIWNIILNVEYFCFTTKNFQLSYDSNGGKAAASCLVGWILCNRFLPTRISDIHAILCVCLCVLSLMEHMDERVRHWFTWSYYMVTLITELRHRRLAKVVHHALSIVGGTAIFLEPHWITERLASKVMLIEASTPFLNSWKRTKSNRTFVVFALMFFLTRTIWLGSIVRSIWGRTLYVPRLCAMVWALNQLWLVQIGIRLLRLLGTKSTRHTR